MCLLLTAQETRHVVSRATGNTAVDNKPNSPDIPDAMVVSSHVQRFVVFRFKYDVDLLAGLQKMVAQEHIKNAVILSAFGSVRGYQVHQVDTRDMPVKDIYVKNPTEPADILGMSGMVMGGRVHPHITLAVPGKSFGGHLEPETRVFTFAVVTLGVLDDDLDMSKFDDWNVR